LLSQQVVTAVDLWAKPPVSESNATDRNDPQRQAQGWELLNLQFFLVGSAFAVLNGLGSCRLACWRGVRREFNSKLGWRRNRTELSLIVLPDPEPSGTLLESISIGPKE
jgi:hypothetical protein